MEMKLLKRELQEVSTSLALRDRQILIACSRKKEEEEEAKEEERRR